MEQPLSTSSNTLSSKMNNATTWQWGDSEFPITKELSSGLLGLLLVAWLVLSRSRKGSSSSSPPIVAKTKDGKRLPAITTDVRSMKFQDSRKLSKMVEDKSGKSPCVIRSGPSQELVISQPQDIREFYEKDYERHTKPQGLALSYPLEFVMPGAVGAQHGERLQKIRKHFGPPMAPSAVSKRVPRFFRELRQWVNNLELGTVDSHVTFKTVVFRMLTLHLYEDAFDDRMFWTVLENHERFEKALEVTVAGKGEKKGLFSKGLAPAVKKFHQMWNDFNQSNIKLARSGKWVCPVEAIYRGVSHDKDITDEEFISTLSEILFSNVESSSQILSTVFTNLAARPAIQKALRHEVEQNKTNDKTIEAYIHKSDTLMNRVVQESMRLSPAVSFTTPEATAETKTIGGYQIPPGTSVVVDAYRLNHDADFWGSDYAEWNPNRFQRIPAKDLHYGFMGYGVGPTTEQWLGKDAVDAVFKLTIMATLERLALTPEKKTAGGSSADLHMAPL